MTITLERYESSVDTETEIDFDPADADETEFDVTDLSLDCSDLGEHRDAYVLEEDSYTVTLQCESCGDTFKEQK